MTSLAGTDIAGELEVGASAVAIMESKYCRRSTRTRDIMHNTTVHWANWLRRHALHLGVCFLFYLILAQLNIIIAKQN